MLIGPVHRMVTLSKAHSARSSMSTLHELASLRQRITPYSVGEEGKAKRLASSVPRQLNGFAQRDLCTLD